MSSQTIKLTQFSKASGCGCKIPPSVLDQILKTDSQTIFTNLIVGNQFKDDAAVLDLGSGNSIISTTDFFTPIVDDPYDFGRIAAANALSDVYAMGGKPLMALSILGWPVSHISSEIASVVLNGARNICSIAGIPLAGGHSIDSTEPIFGLSVTGIVANQNVKRNNTVKVDDDIYLTKPIGTGILSSALKRNVLDQEDLNKLINLMSELNKIGEVLGGCEFVNAMTDVTGFGLIGHLSEMLNNSDLCVELNFDSIPIIKNVEKYSSKFIYPDNTTRNYNAYKDLVVGMDKLEFILLCDPQTSGGLLISCDPNYKQEMEHLLESNNVSINRIGKITQASENGKKIILK